jgi:hypothetical protein
VKRWVLAWVAAAIVGAGAINVVVAAEPQEPEITAQGFDIADIQEGALGSFQRLRVRFEVPARIERLNIQERSYEVDLAITPEADHLPLFGLARQVRQLTDVTLDFSAYINQKIDTAGDYKFELTVADRQGRETSAVLMVTVVAPTNATLGSNDRTLTVDTFRFVRAGSARASGAEVLGLGWKTIEGHRVIIRLTPLDSTSSHLFELQPNDWEVLETPAQLLNASQQRESRPNLDLATAVNRAAGTVFGVVSGDVPHIVKVNKSTTSLSDVGTTVTLVGEYKF